MIQGIAATFALIVGLVGMMALMNRLVAAGRVHPEVSRKTMHVGMGLACLTMPWVFPEPLWFAIGFTLVLATLAAVRYVPAIARHTTGALHAVERSSGGDVYFALSVALLYAVARDAPVLYVTPILVLTLADALAALAGIFYAKTAYNTLGGSKSWEGSIVFFIVAFLCIHLMILLLSSLSPLEGLTVSLTLAYVATLVEGASWEGLDNLFLPVAIYLLLDGFLRMNEVGVAENVGLTSAISLVALTALGWIVARLSRIPTDATMALVAFAYVFWTVSEFAIMVPGIVVGLTCIAASLLWSSADPTSLRGRTIAAACAPVAGLVILAAQGISLPIVTASHAGFAAALGFILPGLLYRHKTKSPSLVVGGVLGIASGSLLILSWFVVGERSGQPATAAAAVQIFGWALGAGLFGGTVWSARLNETHWLMTLCALVSVGITGAALFRNGAIL